jgi:small-conductance mechanosensitive channel
MSESVVNLFTNILIAVAIGAVGYLLAWVTARVLKQILSRVLSPSWSAFLANLAALGIILLAIKLIVDQTGATGAFVVVVTALTGAFAIGSNDLAADFVSGVKLLFLNHYAVGDMVTIAGHTGKIEDISMTNTIVETRRRDHVIIPNSQALGQIIVNHSRVPGHLVNAQIPIPGEHDRDQVMAIMQEAAQAFPARMDVRDALVLLDDFGIKTTYYKVIIIVDEDNWRLATSARLRLTVTQALEARDIAVGEAEVIQIAR